MAPLPLDDPRWQHEIWGAYGRGQPIPDLIRRAIHGADVWMELFGHLCHQGTPSEAGYAAAPHLLAALEQDSGIDAVAVLTLLGQLYQYPPDDVPWFDPAHVALAEQLGLRELARQRGDHEAASAVLSAIAAVRGWHDVVHVMSDYEDRSFELSCPVEECRAEFFAGWEVEDSSEVKLEAPRHGCAVRLGLRPQESSATHLTVLAQLAAQAGHRRLARDLRQARGEVVCPECNTRLSVPDCLAQVHHPEQAGSRGVVAPSQRPSSPRGPDEAQPGIADMVVVRALATEAGVSIAESTQALVAALRDVARTRGHATAEADWRGELWVSPGLTVDDLLDDAYAQALSSLRRN